MQKHLIIGELRNRNMETIFRFEDSIEHLTDFNHFSMENFFITVDVVPVK